MDDRKIGNDGVLNNISNIVRTDHQFIRGQLSITPLNTEPGAGIALWIQINDQHFFANSRQSGC
jgi:hypothetical protein